jgi:hypothetical protein
VKGEDVCISKESIVSKTYGTVGLGPRNSRYISTAVGITTSKDNTPPFMPTKPGRCRMAREAPLNRYDLRANDRRTKHRHATPFAVDQLAQYK